MTTILQNIRQVLVTEIKFLTFQNIQPDFKRLANYYLVFGLFITWLVGMGRYWDNPRAEVWQTLGLGSLAYIFILAFILWALIKPLYPENWHYKSVLIFVGMTSPPALLYAIPVERYFDLTTAQVMNIGFLAVVAIWRVALLFVYLIRSAKLGWVTVIVAAVLPIAIIITALTVLNLEHVVFRLMGGLLESERSANDTAYGIMGSIAIMSVVASPILLLAYGVMVAMRRKAMKSNRENK